MLLGFHSCLAWNGTIISPTTDVFQTRHKPWVKNDLPSTQSRFFWDTNINISRNNGKSKIPPISISAETMETSYISYLSWGGKCYIEMVEILSASLATPKQISRPLEVLLARPRSPVFLQNVGKRFDGSILVGEPKTTSLWLWKILGPLSFIVVDYCLH